jgi:protein-S-isoprenylcysteine O-methyltransferase Ste14
MSGIIIFLLGSIGFVILSRKAFFNPHLHGFPRFFAFEAILGLVVVNAPVWFASPFSPLQIVSWVLLLGSLLIAIHAFRVLHKFGNPDKSIPDASRLGLEKTTRLVRKGLYRVIRHPMYASLLCFAWGAFLKQIASLSIILLVLASLALITTAFLEERENLRNFGDEYADYMKCTRRFIPFIF